MTSVPVAQPAAVVPPRSGLAARCITPPSFSCLLRGRTMAFLQYIRPSHNNWVNVSRSASYRRVNVSSLRSYASPSAPFNHEHTVPNYSQPSRINGRKVSRADQAGYLSFTRTSLYKLTLPLIAPAGEASTVISKASPEASKDHDGDGLASFPQGVLDNGAEEVRERRVSWEQQVESGNQPVPRDHRSDSEGTEDEGSNVQVHSVVFLLHPGQPLSYIANLIRAEYPELESDVADSHKKSGNEADPTGAPPITFHTCSHEDKRWSPATGIGDFLREAARAGSFTIHLGRRLVTVKVPSFEDRTRFLRTSLHVKTAKIERLAKVKTECDRLGKQSTRRVAFAGAGVLGVWWVTVGVLTFHTPLGWDTMEPITYLTGYGTVIGGYIWFLWHNREVNYQTVMTESTSRKQQQLYVERGFSLERYHELIDEVKDLRKAIKRIAWDYDLSWDQGETEAGQKAKRALRIVRDVEQREKEGRMRHEKEEEQDGQDDDDGHEGPDGRSSR